MEPQERMKLERLRQEEANLKAHLGCLRGTVYILRPPPALEVLEF